MTAKQTLPLTCVAHRGGRKLGTENTLATIEKALQLGVDAIEIDVWRVGSQLIVTHDREFGRVITGNGRVVDLRPTEIRTLRHYDGSTVATLDTVMNLVGNKARLNIELKGPDCAEAVAAMINGFCRDHGTAIDQFIVSSFDHQQLYWLQQHAAKIPRGVLIYGHLHDGIACCQALQAYSYHPSIDFIDPQSITQARQLGMEVWVFTVNRTDDFEELQSLGVTGVFTDDPELLLAFNTRGQSSQQN